MEKVEALLKIFQSINLPPFIQLLSSREKEKFEEIVSQLNDLKKKYKIKYSVHQSMWSPNPDFYPNLGSSDKEIKQNTLESFKKSIDFAKLIGAKNVSFHPGISANKISQKEELQPLEPIEQISYGESYHNVKENLKELLTYSQGEIKLSLENLNWRPERRYLFCQPEDFTNLPEEVGVLFDTGHAYFSQNRTKDPHYMKKIIDKIAGKITEIHASDNSGTEDEHKLPGFGKVPFKELFKQISKKQKLPPIIVEASQKKHSYSEQDLVQSIKMLEELQKI